jgi:hypothetical protein
MSNKDTIGGRIGGPFRHTEAADESIEQVEAHESRDESLIARTSEHGGTRQRTDVQRDVTWLLDELAPERPVPKHDVPVPAVKCHRVPGRCILQAETRAVSVSWFPTRSGSDTLGELVITSWHGTLSLPGSARRSRTAAEPIETLDYHPVLAESRWEWRLGGTGRGVLISALAARVRRMLEG